MVLGLKTFCIKKYRAKYNMYSEFEIKSSLKAEKKLKKKKTYLDYNC